MKEVKRISPNTKIAFSSITIRKDKKGIDKNVVETNARLKNYCSQKKLDYIENTNIKEEHLGVKKLHLNKRGNSLLATNFLRYLRSTFWDNLTSGYSELQNAEYKSIPVLHEQMSGDGDSFKSLKEVRLKNLNRIVLAHLNINSLRNKFDALVEQVSGNVDVLVLSETKIDE